MTDEEWKVIKYEIETTFSRLKDNSVIQSLFFGILIGWVLGIMTSVISRHIP